MLADVSSPMIVESISGLLLSGIAVLLFCSDAVESVEITVVESFLDSVCSAVLLHAINKLPMARMVNNFLIANFFKVRWK